MQVGARFPLELSGRLHKAVVERLRVSKLRKVLQIMHVQHGYVFEELRKCYYVEVLFH